MYCRQEVKGQEAILKMATTRSRIDCTRMRPFGGQLALTTLSHSIPRSRSDLPFGGWQGVLLHRVLN